MRRRIALEGGKVRWWFHRGGEGEKSDFLRFDGVDQINKGRKLDRLSVRS